MWCAGPRTIEDRETMQHEIPRPYLLFLGEQTSAPHAKTAFGLRDWGLDSCIWGVRLARRHSFHRIADTDTHARGARSLVIGRRTNPEARCGGVSLNTSTLDESSAESVLAEYAKTLRLPVADPIRGSPDFDRLINECVIR